MRSGMKYTQSKTLFFHKKNYVCIAFHLVQNELKFCFGLVFHWWDERILAKMVNNCMEIAEATFYGDWRKEQVNEKNSPIPLGEIVLGWSK